MPYKDPEKKKENNKKHYQKNKEKILEQSKNYHKQYDKEHREQKNAWQRERMKDPTYRLNRNISSSIRNSLKTKNLSKNKRHWEGLVGYTKQQLKEHLESLFTKGMTWDNHGLYGWHIDHIIPKDFFEYTSTDDVEFKYCWSLDNLQPLWAGDNLSKGNRIIN